MPFLSRTNRPASRWRVRHLLIRIKELPDLACKGDSLTVTAMEQFSSQIVQRSLWPLLLLVCFTSVAQRNNSVSSRDLERLLDAIAQVESNNYSRAVGDGGRALGRYQIHKAYWKDGIRILGVKWSYRDASDPQKARQVVRAYLSHYGKGKTLIQIARIHNGGPRGYRKKATLCYGRKIRNLLKQKKTS